MRKVLARHEGDRRSLAKRLGMRSAFPRVWRLASEHGSVLRGLRAAASRFVWDSYGSPEALEATRLSTMKHFLEDFEETEAGRYVAAALPRLPFPDGAFDLALCSHFLFLYSAQFDDAFHVDAVRELCRVARELRVFPLLDLDGLPSAHLGTVQDGLAEIGWDWEVRRVGYEFQKGGNEMLRAWRRKGRSSAKVG